YFQAYSCGMPAFIPIASRVVGGENAKPHSWPWQVSLQIIEPGRQIHVCGGTLIATNWVLTAAHCAVQQSPAEINLFPSLSFLGLCFRNDLALIKLSQRVRPNNKIQPACLPPAGSILPNRFFCFITGWGRLSTGGPLPEVLQEARMPIVDYATCSRPNWWGSIVKTTMVCAGGDGNVSGCNGDSGGPLICRPGRVWQVHGITSFVSSQGCNIFQKPTVFTRVSAYIDWIRKVASNERWWELHPWRFLRPR
uniref:Chymotrypsin-like elastase family member 2A n=1 Tax=Crocodylus porosus TaxID=8502 RepID=A0A7M4FLE6_CROPO